VDKNGHLELDASAGKFEGDVTADGKHINWVDGSYWRRAIVYGLERR